MLRLVLHEELGLRVLHFIHARRAVVLLLWLIRSGNVFLRLLGLSVRRVFRISVLFVLRLGVRLHVGLLDVFGGEACVFNRLLILLDNFFLHLFLNGLAGRMDHFLGLCRVRFCNLHGSGLGALHDSLGDAAAGILRVLDWLFGLVISGRLRFIVDRQRLGLRLVMLVDKRMLMQLMRLCCHLRLLNDLGGLGSRSPGQIVSLLGGLIAVVFLERSRLGSIILLLFPGFVLILILRFGRLDIALALSRLHFRLVLEHLLLRHPIVKLFLRRLEGLQTLLVLGAELLSRRLLGLGGLRRERRHLLGLGCFVILFLGLRSL